MPSSERPRALGLAVLVALGTFASSSGAQQAPQGFAVERFYPSAPGGGWFVMDTLDMHGALGGAMALTGSYAHKPLRVTDTVHQLPVVSDEAIAGFAFAVTYGRWRFYLDVDTPLVLNGESGRVGAYQFTHPAVDLGANPDTVSDGRFGLDARLYGRHDGPLRLGLGTQLFVPNGKRSDYVTDGTVRAMIRALVAGDLGRFTYAGHLGVHIRQVDDAPTPGSPQGSELLFGVAAGPRWLLGASGRTALVVGPELYGETAFRSAFSATGTGLEGLLSGRLEGTGGDGLQVRVKLGTGGGLNQHFGAPEWRFVAGVEIFDHRDR